MLNFYSTGAVSNNSASFCEALGNNRGKHNKRQRTKVALSTKKIASRRLNLRSESSFFRKLRKIRAISVSDGRKETIGSKENDPTIGLRCKSFTQ